MSDPKPAHFELDPRLIQDCIPVGDLTLCQVLLMNDASYPWLILVPRIQNISEIYQLSEAEQQQLMSESSALSQAMADYYQPKKMNVANLGNIVSQLHIHHIARFESDPAWPGPVWGHQPAVSYADMALQQRLGDIKKFLSALPGLVN